MKPKPNRDVKKISKNELIQAVSDASSINVHMVKMIVETLEDVVKDFLKDANEANDISIRLFDGFYVESFYMPGSTMKNNLTGKLIRVASKIKTKVRVTRTYSERIYQ